MVERRWGRGERRRGGEGEERRGVREGEEGYGSGRVGVGEG